MADLPAPYFDPSQYPAYLDAQRKQQIAQMLMGSLQSANSTPSDWNQMKQVPKRGMLQNVGVLADALMAKKGMDASNQSTSQYMQGLFGGGQPAAVPSAAAAASEGPPAPGAAPGAPAQGLVQSPQAQQNPMIPQGMTRQQATMISAMPGGMESLTKIMAGNFTPLEITRQLTSAGIDPNSPQGQMIQQAAIKKATTNVQDVGPGKTLFDVNKGSPIFTGPDQGVNTTWGPDGKPIQASIAGAEDAAKGMASAKTEGTQSETYTKIGTDSNGRDIFAKLPNATGSSTASAADIEGQKKGAESGQTYAAELAKNATGATEVRRSLSELKNLASQATPSAANESKAKLGAFMIAAGADPDTVAKWTGVDTGALQAAQKQTATLAVNSIHSMTSRGTNFDLETFIKNNPNLNLADPAAFNRVADYMNNKATQDIAKQKDFAQWKKGVSPDDWETGHTAHWLEKQNADIDAGHSNSPRPTPTLQELQAEAARRGLKPQ